MNLNTKYLCIFTIPTLKTNKKQWYGDAIDIVMVWDHLYKKKITLTKTKSSERFTCKKEFM